METKSAIHDLLGVSACGTPPPFSAPLPFNAPPAFNALEQKTLDRALVTLSALGLRFHVVGRGVEFGAPILPEKPERSRGNIRNPGVMNYARASIETMVVGESRTVVPFDFALVSIQSCVCHAGTQFWGEGSVTTMANPDGTLGVLRLL